jgi:predicted RecB family nuclease
LKGIGINSIEDLVDTEPEQISKKVSGASKSMVSEWQKAAKEL